MPMTGAGQRDKRVLFERATKGRGSLGGMGTTGWTGIGSRWAKVLYGSGSERRQAAVESAVQPATFRLLADTLTRSITAEDRIIFAGLAYDITGIAPIGALASDEIEFTAVANRG